MKAPWRKWVLSGVVAGTGLVGLGACSTQDKDLEGMDNQAQTAEFAGNEDFAGVERQSGAGRQGSPHVDRMNQGYVPPVGAGTGGSGLMREIPESAYPQSQYVQQPLPNSGVEGQGGAGQNGVGRVETGTPATTTASGGNSRSNFRGLEPYSTPPQPTPGTVTQPGDRGVVQQPITAPGTPAPATPEQPNPEDPGRPQGHQGLKH
jgi:hypothetical protein